MLLLLLVLLSTIYLLLLLSLPTTISIDHANHDCDDGDDEDADDDEQEERARERERVREKSIPIDDDDNQKVDTLAQIWFKRRGASTCTLQHMPVSSSASHRTATQVGAAIHKQLPLPLHIVACTDRQRTVDSGQRTQGLLRHSLPTAQPVRPKIEEPKSVAKQRSANVDR